MIKSLIKISKVVFNLRFWSIVIERKLYWAAYHLDIKRPCAICHPPWIYGYYGDYRWCCHPYSRHTFRVWNMSSEEIENFKRKYENDNK